MQVLGDAQSQLLGLDAAHSCLSIYIILIDLPTTDVGTELNDGAAPPPPFLTATALETHQACLSVLKVCRLHGVATAFFISCRMNRFISTFQIIPILEASLSCHP